MKKNIIKKVVSFLVLIVVCTFSIGYAAFGSELSIGNIVAEVRIKADIRITSMIYSSALNGGLSQYENYDVDSVVGSVTLPASNSTIVYKIGVTNFGNQEMGIFSITGLPSNLTYEISDYDLHDKICDSTGSCSLGVTKNFYITIKYVDGGFDSSNVSYDIKLDFDFRKMHQVTYTGITNNNYPTSIIDGGNLTFTTTANIPPKIIVFYSNNDRVDYDSYSFSNNVFTYNNVTSDINLKYQEKAYLKKINTDTEFKESKYKTAIDSVQFVNYVDTKNAVATYDLSEVSGSKDVVGWITSDNDLYIGSEWKVFSKDFTNFFYGMSNIKFFSFNNLDTSEVASMEYMFSNLSVLETIDLSNFNTSQVTNMSGMFRTCYDLQYIYVGDGWDTSSVTVSESMFLYTSLLPNYDSGVVDVTKAYVGDGGYLSSL